MKQKPNHDLLVRKYLTDKEAAKDFLLAHLPAEVLDICDLDSITVEPTSYIEDDLREHCSDIVHKLKIKNSKKTAYIYTLVEHQSSAVKLMPFRILKYQVAIIDKHLKEHKGSELPLVFPLVLYNGTATPYPYSANIADLFVDREIYQKLPLGNFKLLDLTVTDDNEILQHRKAALMELVTKHIRSKGFIAVIPQIIQALQLAHELGIDHSLVDSIVIYMMQARENNEIKELSKQVKDNAPYYEDTIMTYAESVKKEGVKIGIQLGKQEGRQEGLQLGEQKVKEIAKKMLANGMEQKMVAEITNLSIEQIETLH
jgi:predicted transposase/invertase (TIGR01784 family)